MRLGYLIPAVMAGVLGLSGCGGEAPAAPAVPTVAVPTVQGLIVTWNAAEQQLAIGIDGGTLGFLMVSGLLTVIGWAMREAARVKAENEGFV